MPHRSSTSSSDLPQVVIGAIIGERYEVTGVLGRGGFATVYSGRQLDLDRPVAIKVLDRLVDEEDRTRFLTRFLREAQIAASISHPNVVTIYAHGLHEETSQAYIVMDLMNGHDLHRELRTSGAIAPLRAWKLLVPCLDALGDLHQQGIIHKDLKPGNFFLMHPGHAYKELLRLLDFGVARIQRHEVTRVTRAGKFIGTPRYLAPEYIRDDEISPAVDVYQMGLILTEMLVGKPVVQTKDPLEALQMHLNGELGLPEKLMKGPLGAILSRATALELMDRYPDAHGLRDALEGLDPDDIFDAEGLAVSAVNTSGSLLAPESAANTTPSTEEGAPASVAPDVPNTEEIAQKPEVEEVVLARAPASAEVGVADVDMSATRKMVLEPGLFEPLEVGNTFFETDTMPRSVLVPLLKRDARPSSPDAQVPLEGGGSNVGASLDVSEEPAPENDPGVESAPGLEEGSGVSESGLEERVEVRAKLERVEPEAKVEPEALGFDEDAATLTFSSKGRAVSQAMAGRPVTERDTHQLSRSDPRVRSVVSDPIHTAATQQLTKFTPEELAEVIQSQSSHVERADPLPVSEPSGSAKVNPLLTVAIISAMLVFMILLIVVLLHLTT